jgi:hypothetical protein
MIVGILVGCVVLVLIADALMGLQDWLNRNE